MGRHSIKPLPISQSQYLVSTLNVCKHSEGAGCSLMVGRRIDPSWGGPIEQISCSSQCSTTGVTKAVVCAILSVGWCI